MWSGMTGRQQTRTVLWQGTAAVARQRFPGMPLQPSHGRQLLGGKNLSHCVTTSLWVANDLGRCGKTLFEIEKFVWRDIWDNTRDKAPPRGAGLTFCVVTLISYYKVDKI